MIPKLTILTACDNQHLLILTSACENLAVRAFLSRQSVTVGERALNKKPLLRSFSTGLSSDKKQGQGNVVKSLYRQVAASLDDMFLGPSMLDVMTDRLNKQAAGAWDAGLVNLGNLGAEIGSSYFPNSLGSSAPYAPFPQTGAPRKSSDVRDETLEVETGSSFTGHICDLLVELFGFKDTNWVRKQALVMIVQQLLGGTIER